MLPFLPTDYNQWWKCSDSNSLFRTLGHIMSCAQEFDTARAYSIINSGNILSQFGIFHFNILMMNLKMAKDFSIEIYLCMHIRMHACTYVCIYVLCMYVCVHVCMYFPEFEHYFDGFAPTKSIPNLGSFQFQGNRYDLSNQLRRPCRFTHCEQSLDSWWNPDRQCANNLNSPQREIKVMGCFTRCLQSQREFTLWKARVQEASSSWSCHLDKNTGHWLLVGFLSLCSEILDWGANSSINVINIFFSGPRSMIFAGAICCLVDPADNIDPSLHHVAFIWVAQDMSAYASGLTVEWVKECTSH